MYFFMQQACTSTPFISICISYCTLSSVSSSSKNKNIFMNKISWNWKFVLVINFRVFYAWHAPFIYSKFSRKSLKSYTFLFWITQNSFISRRRNTQKNHWYHIHIEWDIKMRVITNDLILNFIHDCILHTLVPKCHFV